MKTALLLGAMYDGKPVIPVDVVCRDFFPPHAGHVPA